MSDEASSAREERLAAKLRENLRRRKARARALGTSSFGDRDEAQTSPAPENESGGLSKSAPES